MSKNEIILAALFLIFMAVGSLIDTYVSRNFHKHKNPKNPKLKGFKPEVEPPFWLSNHILVWWLAIFVIGLPFLMLYTASGFNSAILRMYLVFGVLASVIWDLVFSKIWSGKWTSDSCITWFWVGKYNIGFTKDQIGYFLLARTILFIILFYVFYIK